MYMITQKGDMYTNLFSTFSEKSNISNFVTVKYSLR